MAVKNYLDLTGQLAERFVDEHFDKSIYDVQKEDFEKSGIIKIEQNGQRELLLNISDIGGQTVLITAIDSNNKSKGEVLKWPEGVLLGNEDISRDSQSLVYSVLFKLLFFDDFYKKLDSRPPLKDEKDSKTSIENPILVGGPSTTGTFRSRPVDMPDFEDEYEVRGPARGGIPNHPVIPSIGDQDLNPLAKPGDGGMQPSMDHPIFGQRRGGASSRLGVPPGARYDDPYAEDNLDDVANGLPPLPRNFPSGGPRFNDDGFPGGPPGGSFGFM